MSLATLSIDIVAKLASLEADLGKAVRLNEKAAADIAKRWDSVGKGIGQGLSAVTAGLSVGVFTEYFRTLADGVDKLNDVSDATGATVESISQLEDIARRTGGNIDVVETSLVKLNAALSAKPDSEQAQILKAIGLDAEELRKMDPADALKAVADALAKYEASGNKARLGAGLLGKSWKELAPFLKDLAENGLGVAKVTTQQAEEAEKFNKQLAALSKNSEDAARSLLADILPALNQTLEAFSKFKQFGPGLVTAGIEALKGNVFSEAGEGARFYSEKLADVDKELGQLREKTKDSPLGQMFWGGQVKSLEDERGKLQKLVSYYQSLQTGAGGGRGSVNPSAQPLLKAPDLPQKPEDNSAELEKIRKAKLDADLSGIKDRSEALIKIYSGSESILEAIRSAGLLSEQEYYDSKRAFINLDAQAKDKELADEIARLNQEKVNGAERIKIQKQIADLTAKRGENRTDAAIKLETLALQEVSATKRIAAAYEDARRAAQDYLDTLTKQQQRTLTGIGQGSQAREKSAGIAQIEDKYASQRQELENNRAKLELEGKFTADSKKEYESRLALIKEFEKKSLDSYEQYFNELDAKRKDGNAGTREALIDYVTSAEDAFSQSKNLAQDSLKGIEDAFVSFVKTGKLSFSDLASSIVADLTRIMVQAAITKPLAEMLLGSFGISGGSSVLPGIGISGQRATGGPVGAGKLYEVAENGPELLSMGNKTLLMMGKQAGQVTPITGGVSRGSSGAMSVSVNVNNTVGEIVTPSQLMQVAEQTRRAVMAGVADARMRGRMA